MEIMKSLPDGWELSRLPVKTLQGYSGNQRLFSAMKKVIEQLEKGMLPELKTLTPQSLNVYSLQITPVEEGICDNWLPLLRTNLGPKFVDENQVWISGKDTERGMLLLPEGTIATIRTLNPDGQGMTVVLYPSAIFGRWRDFPTGIFTQDGVEIMGKDRKTVDLLTLYLALAYAAEVKKEFSLAGERGAGWGLIFRIGPNPIGRPDISVEIREKINRVFDERPGLLPPLLLVSPSAKEENLINELLKQSDVFCSTVKKQLTRDIPKIQKKEAQELARLVLLVAKWAGAAAFVSFIPKSSVMYVREGPTFTFALELGKREEDRISIGPALLGGGAYTVYDLDGRPFPGFFNGFGAGASRITDLVSAFLRDPKEFGNRLLKQAVRFSVKVLG